MPTEPYTRTRAEHSSVLPECSRACREDALYQKEEREDATPKPEECVGKYVCIKHEGRGYPGFVGDTDLVQVYVNCMHSVSKQRLNRFYWPGLLPDLN